MSLLPSTQMRKKSDIESYFTEALVHFLCLLLVASLFPTPRLSADHLPNFVCLFVCLLICSNCCHSTVVSIPYLFCCHILPVLWAFCWWLSLNWACLPCLHLVFLGIWVSLVWFWYIVVIVLILCQRIGIFMLKHTFSLFTHISYVNPKCGSTFLKLMCLLLELLKRGLMLR